MRRLILVTVAALGFLPLDLEAGRPRGVQRPLGTPTWSREVSRIVQRHCQTCHRDGGMAPFSLVDYETAKAWSRSIALVTRKRIMPPWKASPGCGEFVDERRLGGREIEILGAWADAGAPMGDPAELPPPLEFTNDWTLGTPDVELRTAGSFHPPANQDSWRCYVMPHEFAEDTYLRAFDFLPEALDEVHHMIAYVDATGKAEALDALDDEEGYDYAEYGLGFDPRGYIAVFTMGERPFMLDEGVALRIPAGSKIVIQVHYHPHDAEVEADRPRVGLYLSREPVRKLLAFSSVLNGDLYLPAGHPDVLVTASWVVTEPISVLSLGGHMHYLGKRVYVDARMPDGSNVCLLRIEQWDQRWQGMYQYEIPVRLPAGAVVEVRGWYDNSSDNPNNPHDPPRDVYWGESADDEMLIAYLAFVRDSEELHIIPNPGY